ncbi:hypothetical protein EU800_23215 [Tropicimonas sp. IMCC6043]|nr:hypothetical protein EU800_23215 [Tropicimonas sp. IMCC6043]
MEVADETVIRDTVGETVCIFLAGLYQAELGIAQHLKRLAAAPLPWARIDADKALPWIEERTGLTLADNQAEAIRLALRSKVLVVTGGPGVGKTTIVNSILRILAAKSVELLLCAPTGRAAKRMSEATGREAKTIHRLLEFDPMAGRSASMEDLVHCCPVINSGVWLSNLPTISSSTPAAIAAVAKVLRWAAHRNRIHPPMAAPFVNMI